MEGPDPAEEPPPMSRYQETARLLAEIIDQNGTEVQAIDEDQPLTRDELAAEVERSTNGGSEGNTAETVRRLRAQPAWRLYHPGHGNVMVLIWNDQTRQIIRTRTRK